MMNNLKWLGHTSTILDIQKNLRHDEASCDASVASRGKFFRAHKFVLSASSDLLRDLLSDVPANQEATIILPDTKDHILDSVIGFIYNGQVNLGSSHLSDFLETTNFLGIKSAISFECPAPKIEGTLVETTEYADTEEDVITEKEAEEDASQGTDQAGLKEFEYLEVYNNEPGKMSYTIEHVEATPCTATDTPGEYILSETGGTYTLTQHNPAAHSTLIAAKTSGHELTESESTTEHHIEDDDKQLIKPKLKRIKMDTVVAIPSTSSSSIDTSHIKSESLPSMAGAFNRVEALDGAVEAVVKGGMSLQKAATKFCLSKTVLWRRVKKHPLYTKTFKENPLIDLACEKLKAGESLKNISISLDIPMSTLHRHKVRLAQEGRLPDYVTFKKRGPVSKAELKEKLTKAVEACVNGMSQNHAATVYDIPKSTLWRHLQKHFINIGGTEVKPDTQPQVVSQQIVTQIVKQETTDSL